MGTAALITHAGVPMVCWPFALPCYCFGHNTTIVDGASSYFQRFGENFDQSKMFPFGAEIKFVPSEIIGDAAMQFAGTTEAGVFMGYGVNSGLVWSGDYIVSHIRQFANVNYLAGRRKEDDKHIVVQLVRDVQSVGPSINTPFTFPFECAVTRRSTSRRGGSIAIGTNRRLPRSYLRLAICRMTPPFLMNFSLSHFSQTGCGGPHRHWIRHHQTAA
jgi:hypothetical protein